MATQYKSKGFGLSCNLPISDMAFEEFGATRGVSVQNRGIFRDVGYYV
jgi:hypothetical protein